MASEYMFGVRSDYGRLPGWDRAKRCDVAEQHGCRWTEIHDEQTGHYKSWFSAPNAGEPFNTRKERAVMRALEEASDGCG